MPEIIYKSICRLLNCLTVMAMEISLLQSWNLWLKRWANIWTPQYWKDPKYLYHNVKLKPNIHFARLVETLLMERQLLWSDRYHNILHFQALSGAFKNSYIAKKGVGGSVPYQDRDLNRSKDPEGPLKIQSGIAYLQGKGLKKAKYIGKTKECKTHHSAILHYCCMLSVSETGQQQT